MVSVGHAETPLTLTTSGEGSSKTFSVEAPGESVHIYVDGVAGQWLTITPSEAGLAGSFSLFDPTGHRVWGAEGDLTEAHGPVLLGETGTYEIVLTGAAGEATGSVRLSAALGPPAPLGSITPQQDAEGALRHVTVPSYGRAARYSVEVAAGQRISLKTTNSEFNGAYELRWVGPSGNVFSTTMGYAHEDLPLWVKT